MGFINPKLYLAFIKIFGSNESREILMSFLNAMLYAGQPIIEDLEIIDFADLAARTFCLILKNSIIAGKKARSSPDINFTDDIARSSC
jgi:hypothetical protein